MAEMFGKQEGCSPRPRRLDAPVRRGHAASTAATRSSAAGCRSRWASRWPTRCSTATRVTACFFGDGAVAEGAFHESLNLAALWQLPVLFCCENNLYAMGTALERAQSQTDLRRKAARYRRAGAAGRRDGRRRACTTRPRDGAEHVRTGAARTSSSSAPTGSGRTRCSTRSSIGTRAEVEEWSKRDPIARFTERASRDGMLSRRRASRRSRPRVDAEVAAAVAFAEAGTWEPVEDLERDVLHGRAGGAADEASTYREAVREAMREALRGDPRVFLMGEDVGRYGGTYAASQGPARGVRPGQRVRDTPLSELGFVGAGIGAALGGHAPDRRGHDGQLQPAGAGPDRQQRRDAAAHVGRAVRACRWSIRMATGAGRQLAAQHSHSLEGWYAHIPGIKVLAPGDASRTPAACCGPALADPDPVLIFEHVQLYNTEDDISTPPAPVDI